MLVIKSCSILEVSSFRLVSYLPDAVTLARIKMFSTYAFSFALLMRTNEFSITSQYKKTYLRTWFCARHCRLTCNFLFLHLDIVCFWVLSFKYTVLTWHVKSVWYLTLCTDLQNWHTVNLHSFCINIFIFLVWERTFCSFHNLAAVIITKTQSKMVQEM